MFTFSAFFFACAPESLEITSTDAPLAEVETLVVRVDGYDPAVDGEMVVDLVPYMAGSPAVYGSPVAYGVVQVDGDAEIPLPVGPEPLDDELLEARFRVVLHPLIDGVPGPVQALLPDSLVWRDLGDPQGAPTGWSVEKKRGNSTTWRTLPELVKLPMNFLTEEELTLGGPIMLDGDAEVGVVLVAGGEIVPGVVGVAMDGRWGLHLNSVPTALRSAGAQAHPVAYVERDGELGWDPKVEPRVGEACVAGRPIGVSAQPETIDVGEAAAMAAQRLVPGLNAVRSEYGRAVGVRDIDSVELAASCE